MFHYHRRETDEERRDSRTGINSNFIGRYQSEAAFPSVITITTAQFEKQTSEETKGISRVVPDPITLNVKFPSASLIYQPSRPARGSENSGTKFRVPPSLSPDTGVKFTRRLTRERVEEDVSRSQRTPTPTPSPSRAVRFLGALLKRRARLSKGRHAGHRKHFTRGTLRPSPFICEIGESTLNYIARRAFLPFIFPPVNGRSRPLATYNEYAVSSRVCWKRGTWWEKINWVIDFRFLFSSFHCLE